MRSFAVWFLLAQAVGATAWWVVLLSVPSSRPLFMAQGAPDATLMAFSAADGLLFIGSAATGASGMWMMRGWGWPLLCVHAGAAGYAALYCWGLVATTGGNGLWGAVLMSPSLLIPGPLAVALRPRGLPC